MVRHDNPDGSISCSSCGQDLPVPVQDTGASQPVRQFRWTKVCPRCGVPNGWTVTYCVECGQSLRPADIGQAIRYDDATRRMLQENHRQKERRALRRSIYLLTGVVVLIFLALVFAPLNTSVLNVAVVPSGLTQTGHYELFIDGGYVGEGDIDPSTIVIWTIPYHFAWDFGGQHQITVEGTIDHLPGDHNDSRTLTVADGKTYSLTLNL